MILYATCTLNRSYLSPYAPDIEFTPHLEAFDPANTSHRAMIERLRSYKSVLVTAYRQEGTELGVSEDRAKELLRSLGYIE